MAEERQKLSASAKVSQFESPDQLTRGRLPRGELYASFKAAFSTSQMRSVPEMSQKAILFESGDYTGSSRNALRRFVSVRTSPRPPACLTHSS